MVIGLLGNESPDSNRFIPVAPKSENDVRLQATLGNQNPTGLPVGAVRLDNAQLKKGTDFTVSYWLGGQELSTDEISFALGETEKKITVRATGKGNYTNTYVEKEYSVRKVVKGTDVIDLTKAKIVEKGTMRSVSVQSNTGTAVKPEIDVLLIQDRKWVVLDESLYSVEYVNNTMAGKYVNERKRKAVIVVNGVGDNVVGSKTSLFLISKISTKTVK